MNLVLDTHTLFWYLSGDEQLSVPAKNAVETAGKVFVPTIVLLELLYLLQKKKKGKSFLKILNELKEDERIVFLSLDVAMVEIVAQLPMGLEMHDRIIIASAQVLGVPIVTRDNVIKKYFIRTIW